VRLLAGMAEGLGTEDLRRAGDCGEGFLRFLIIVCATRGWRPARRRGRGFLNQPVYSLRRARRGGRGGRQVVLFLRLRAALAEGLSAIELPIYLLFVMRAAQELEASGVEL
jgi:hypothetical protein